MTSPAAQELLPFKEIREGVIILESDALRGILMVSSLNFALKSAEEQGAIVSQFQNFLNSLDFSTQILVQSRRVNLTGYLDKLKDLEKNQTDKLLKIQTADYRKFISRLVKQGTIMNKRFFVIAPYTLAELEISAPIKELFQRKEGAKMSEAVFQRARGQLYQRMEFIAIGLRRCSLIAAPLTSSELIELLWSIYHPQSAEVGYYPSIMPELIK
jgi:hypothetical protein